MTKTTARGGRGGDGGEEAQQQQQQQQQRLQVILPVEEFAEDLDLRLGRANGNIYHRRPGIEGVHDGQYMVRLKKKRFIVIDYSIVPTDADLQAANQSAQISCPAGAGKQKCATPECPKVGVPVLLYDSEPNEPTSLYLRSGLCFTCQRNLNEKRRTQRKRTSDGGSGVAGSGGGGRQSILYASGSGPKRVKLNGDTVELESDAIILNGPPSSDVKTVRNGNGFQEIGMDLSATIRQATQDTDQLLHSITGGNTSTSPDGAVTCLTNGSTAAAATAGDIAAAVAAGVNTDATKAAVDAAKGGPMVLNGDHHHHHTTAAALMTSPASSNANVTALYDKAFHSLSKSLYLLTQWKQAWDAALAAAVAHETAGDPSLAEAVASAAAVAAAASDGQDASNAQNMVSLLLAADQRKDGSSGGGGGEAVPSPAKHETDNVETFEV